MKSLCVASVYGPSKHNNLWFHLQKTFLSKTTKDYDHVVFLDRCDEALFDCKILGSISEPNLRWPTGNNHLLGLEAFLDHFRNNPYYNYLILDSDCFPFKEGWLDKLSRMVRKDRLHFAAIMRSEVGEQYPHPSAFFIPGEFIGQNFNFNRGGIGTKNITQRNRDYDFGSRIITEVNNKIIWLPLVRTNKSNPHYIVAGLYGDIFYHHAAGTHKTILKSKGYWHKILPEQCPTEVLLEALANNPDEFINKLRTCQ